MKGVNVALFASAALEYVCFLMFLLCSKVAVSGWLLYELKVPLGRDARMV